MRREGESIAGISRATGVSEPTVRKYLKPQDLSPKMPVRSKGLSVMGDYAAIVDSWLEAESVRAAAVFASMGLTTTAAVNLYLREAVPTQLVMQNYLLERLFERISLSPWCDHAVPSRVVCHANPDRVQSGYIGDWRQEWLRRPCPRGPRR